MRTVNSKKCAAALAAVLLCITMFTGCARYIMYNDASIGDVRLTQAVFYKDELVLYISDSNHTAFTVTDYFDADNNGLTGYVSKYSDGKLTITGNDVSRINRISFTPAQSNPDTFYSINNLKDKKRCDVSSISFSVVKGGTVS